MPDNYKMHICNSSEHPEFPCNFWTFHDDTVHCPVCKFKQQYIDNDKRLNSIELTICQMDDKLDDILAKLQKNKI